MPLLVLAAFGVNGDPPEASMEGTVMSLSRQMLVRRMVVA